MRRGFLVVVALLLLLPFGVMAQQRAADIRKDLVERNRDYVYVAAHRGDWVNYPENSLAAIQSIIDMGGDIVEIDVQRSKDGVLILMHDKSVDRTTPGSGEVEDLNYSELQELRLRDSEGNLTDYKIPSLEEALMVAKGKILLNLDKAEYYFDEVMELLERTGTLELAIMKGYFPYNVTMEMYSRYFDKILYMPKSRLNYEGAEALVREFMDKSAPVAFELRYDNDENPLPRLVRDIIGDRSLIWYNSLVGYNDVHDDRTAQTDLELGYGYLIDVLGARIIQTDSPEYLLRYLRSRGLHR